MAQPAPVRPLAKHGIEYLAMMRRDLLVPIRQRLDEATRGAEDWGEVNRRVNQSALQIELDGRDVIGESEVKHDIALISERIAQYHTGRSRRLAAWVLSQAADNFAQRAPGPPDELGPPPRMGMTTPQTAVAGRPPPLSLALAVGRVLTDEEVFAWMRQWRRINIGLIVTIPRQAHSRLLERVTRAMLEQPFSRYALHEVVSRNHRLTEYQARRICRDQVNKGIGQLTEVRQRQMGVSRYRWQSSEDQRVRATHQSNNGRVFSWNAPPATGHPGWEIQCFPGDVSILPAGLEASVSYRYVGEIIEIRLADGVKVSTTPNHPILTETGWKRAGDINEGDKLVKCVTGEGFTSLTLDPKHGQTHALAEDVHRLLSGRAGQDWTEVANTDLHGDPLRRQEEIDVVPVKRELRNELESLSRQVFGNLRLEHTDMTELGLHRLGLPVPNLYRPAGIADLIVGSASKLAALSGRSPFHADRLGFGSGSGLEAQVIEAASDKAPAHSQVGLHLFHRLLSGVHLTDPFVEGNPSFEVTRVTSRLSRFHDGPVYNFSTSTGLIVANGIVTHNCRCTAQAIVDAEAIRFSRTKARANLPRPGLGFFAGPDIGPAVPGCKSKRSHRTCRPDCKLLCT